MEELGDLVLQVIFHAQIAKERHAFGIKEILEGIIFKLRTRHPHVFGEEILRTPEEVLANWERIKQEERRLAGNNQGPLAGLPPGLPALLMARRIQDKLSRQGKGVIEGDASLLEERFEVFKKSLSGEDKGRIEDALADLLFLLVELARQGGIDAEDALRKSLTTFSGVFDDYQADS